MLTELAQHDPARFEPGGDFFLTAALRPVRAGDNATDVVVVDGDGVGLLPETWVLTLSRCRERPERFRPYIFGASAAGLLNSSGM
jgi:hypothetical protein